MGAHRVPVVTISDRPIRNFRLTIGMAVASTGYRADTRSLPRAMQEIIEKRNIADRSGRQPFKLNRMNPHQPDRTANRRAILVLFALATTLASPSSDAAATALKEGNAADAPRLSPEQQQATFALPDGFTIELVTSETQGTEKPVALNFDDAGRLWTMTATEYPLDTNDPAHAEAARLKWQTGGKDRILVIDDPLKPGPHTPRVFADGLVMPMSVLPYKDGAIVAHGPDMLWLRDTNRDGRAEERKVLLSGFGIQDSHTMAHQLMWLPDGSLFTAQGVLDSGRITDAAGRATDFSFGKFASFHPDGSGFRVIGAGLNNTWGVLLQRDGRMWVQEANSFDHPVAPFDEGVHFHGWNEQPFVTDTPWQPGVGEVNLGSTGLSGLAMSEDRRGGFPPDWQQVMLIANAVTGVINSVKVTLAPGNGWSVTRGPDLVSSSDRRFRPVHIAFGPDSCLYIVDWYNPVISHNEVPRDHPARDKSSGRIWRVRHTSQTNRQAPNVQAATDEALVTHLQSDTTWEMRAAWHQIAERHAMALIPKLVDLVRNTPASHDDARIHALWCLAALGHYDPTLWETQIQQASPDLAFELVRALRSVAPSARDARMFIHVAGTQSSPRVRAEMARYFQSAHDVSSVELSVIMRWLTDSTTSTVKGVQGDTLPWSAYPQAFLNRQIQRALEAQPQAADELANNPGLLARLPAGVRARLHRLGYTKRFEDGSLTPTDLENDEILAAAIACAAESDRAAALMKAHAAQTPHFIQLGTRLLDDAAVTSAGLKRFAGPLALRLMTQRDAATIATGLDLAALSCSSADSAEFVRVARGIVEAQPALRLPAVRSAIAAGVRDEGFFSALATDEVSEPRVRAAAWPGWFESSDAADKPRVEAALSAWTASLPAADQTDVLSELATTTIGSHLALNDAFPALLAQDAVALPRLADELCDRVPEHGRLAEVRTTVQAQRTIRTAANARHIDQLTAAITGGQLKPDPTAGEPLFTSLCLTCHAAGGKGVGFAPPLDGSRTRDLPALLLALLEPDAAVESVFRPYQVRLRDGTTIEGFLKVRDGNRIALQLMGGALQNANLLRSHTARHVNGHSVMPALAATLSDQQIADLTAFVRGL